MHPRHNGPVQDRSAWRGSDFDSDDSWIYTLNDSDLAELDAALALVTEKGLEARAFSREEFPLPTFGARLGDILDELENGRGFILLRGLPIDRYDEAAMYRLYWGMAVYLGDMISQNAKGDLIGRVEDIGVDYHSFNARGYTTSAKLHPHNDSADLVGLLCMRQAKTGGATMIASALTIYNEILAAHPDYLDVLYDGFHYDIRGEGTTSDPNEVTRNRVPLYSYFDDRLSCRYNSRAILTAADKMKKPLSETERGAVELIAQLAIDPAVRHDMVMQPGDLQILNNHMVLHSRTAFEDWPEAERRRLLLRLWVNRRPGEARDLAPEFANRYNTGHRQGVALAAS
ncbi:MAG: TauD/TfdA family dioxygenase [Rhodospirillaceae bacterium]|nr:TauD/TfdA family dioxygenase [Rhodospirillaceae bacterium]MBT5663821.1 TauD/TfdA family dioxygenase [Rhodospirillaceae bacterium]MBT5809729.1 TauD/TfdA family dioxygenase [Rhodospirillaceae bacterium]